MPTPFESIYTKFLSGIDDYELALIDDESLSETLYNYLSNACGLHFRTCRKDLSKQDSVGFIETLTLEEEHILALGMKKSWLSPKLMNADLMRKEIGDRDYKAVQGTGYIKELRTTMEALDKEIENATIAYSYNPEDLGDW